MNAALFGLGYLTAVAWMPTAVDGFLSLRWAILAVGVPLCLLLCRRPAPFPWPAALLVVIAAWSMLWTTDVLGAVDEISHLLIMLAAFWLGASIADATNLWKGLAYGVATSAAFAVWQHFGWDGIPQSVQPAGLFANKNFLAEAGLIAVIVCFMLRSRALLTLALIAAFLPMSKAVIGAALVVAAFYLAPRFRLAAAGLMGALLLLMIGSFAVPIQSAAIRLAIWYPALSDLTLLGHGLSSFSALDPANEFAHSEPVQLVYELGILSLPFFAFAISLMKDWSHETELEALVLVGVAAVSLVSFPLHMPLTAFAVALAAGRIFGARRRLVERHAAWRAPLGVGA